MTFVPDLHESLLETDPSQIRPSVFLLSMLAEFLFFIL